MSTQPAACAAAGIWLSSSQLRSGEWLKVAAGVAWVMRVVVTAPVAMPSRAASCHSDSSGLRRLAAQSPRAASWPTESMPMRVFTPVAMAVMVPAESGVWASVL